VEALPHSVSIIAEYTKQSGESSLLEQLKNNANIKARSSFFMEIGIKKPLGITNGL
jgi:hypothetical protein